MVPALVHTGTTRLYTRIDPVADRQHECTSRIKKSMFLLVIIGNGLHEHDFRTGILCYLFDLEFPEMGCLNLDLSPGYRNNAVLGRFDSFANFLALTHIELHNFSSMPQRNPEFIILNRVL